MEKTRLHIISTALVLVILLFIRTPVSVAAEENYRFKALSPGKWATNSYKIDNVTYYVVTLKEAGALTFTLKQSYGEGYVAIYNSKNDIINDVRKNNKSVYTFTKNKMVAMEKGTYYLDVRADQCSYTFEAAGKSENYCPSKAKQLKANTTVKIIYNPRMVFDRWYKITNPKKKRISVYTNNSYLSSHATVYTSNLKPLIYTHKSGGEDCIRCDTKELQPKGTYYIRVRSVDHFGTYGTVDTLKWK